MARFSILKFIDMINTNLTLFVSYVQAGNFDKTILDTTIIFLYAAGQV